jgi:hypothetical protein
MTTYFDPSVDRIAITTISYTMLTEMQTLQSLISQFIADPTIDISIDILLEKMRLLNTRYVIDYNTALTPTQGTIERLLFVGTDFWRSAWNEELIYCMNALNALLINYITALRL